MGLSRHLFPLAIALCACAPKQPLPDQPKPPIPDSDLTKRVGPHLLSTTPADASTEVETALRSLTLVFDEGIEIDSLAITTTPALTLGVPSWNDARAEAHVPIEAPLADLTTYQIDIDAADPDGNALPSTSFSFTTAAGTAAPTLLLSQPIDGATGVPTNTQLVFTFSQSIDPSSFELFSEPGQDFGQETWSGEGRTVTFSPTTLAASTTYQLVLSGKNKAGLALTGDLSMTFTTAQGRDMTPPSVLATSPVANAMNVPVQTSISIEFSEAMNIAATEAAMSIMPAVDCSFAWDTASTRVTCTPTDPLTPATQYNVKVGVGARDRSGNPLAAPSTFTFKVAAGASTDTTPPSVVTFSPGNGSNAASRTANLVMTFTEPMDKLSVESAFHIAANCAFSWNAQSTEVTCNPTTNLAYSTTYSWSLAGAKDLAGNVLSPAHASTFTTVAAPADTTPPRVVAMSPTSSGGPVATTAELRVTFSEPMNQMATQASFVAPNGVSCNFSWNSTATQLTCEPQSNLSFSRQYTFSVGTGARDRAGNALAATASTSFSTVAAPDTTRPALVSSTPADGQTGIARNSGVTVRFSEPMNPTSVQGAFSIVSPSGFAAGSFSWNSDKTQFTYLPPLAPPNGTTVTWKIGNTAKDRAGNTLPEVARDFTVLRAGTLTIKAPAALDGHITASGTTLRNVVPDGAIVVGDTALDDVLRGFITFPLNGLPSSLTRIVSATLTVTMNSSANSPFALSSLEVRPVVYGASLDGTDFALPDQVAAKAVFFTSATNTSKQIGVTSWVANDWGNRVGRGYRSQFSLLIPTPNIKNALADAVGFGSGDTVGTPELRIDFEYP